MTLYFQFRNCSIYNDDFIVSSAIPSNYVDLVVTSPPYNVGMAYNQHDDSEMTYEKYLEFTKKYLKKIMDILRYGGRLCLNVPLDRNKGGHFTVYHDVLTIAKSLGYKYHTTIIWNKTTMTNGTAWGSWRSASAPAVIAPIETILVLYKGVWNIGRGVSDITANEFIRWQSGLWTIINNGIKEHPATFPLEIPTRCIKLFSFVNGVVCDPFLGSGTTLIVCSLTNRTGVGVEIDEHYCELSKKRLMDRNSAEKAEEWI